MYSVTRLLQYTMYITILCVYASLITCITIYKLYIKVWTTILVVEGIYGLSYAMIAKDKANVWPRVRSLTSYHMLNTNIVKTCQHQVICCPIDIQVTTAKYIVGGPFIYGLLAHGR
jgi:hypothetical protein